MYSRLVTFIITFLLWLLLSFSLDWQHLLIGGLVALLTAAMMGDMFARQPLKWFSPRRYFWFAVYVLVFSWECLKANIDVALRVLSPHLPINPGIVKIKTALKTETALTFLANSITLTPGTISVDVDQEEGCLYIHWIDVRTQDMEEATQMISARFERILREVFE